MNEPLEGNFEGVGIEFTILRDSLLVVTPVAGGPSVLGGMRADDWIVAGVGVDSSSSVLSIQKVFVLLRGPKGTRVQLAVVRRGE